eukprot:1995377-Amphidinium_carterae.1
MPGTWARQWQGSEKNAPKSALWLECSQILMSELDVSRRGCATLADQRNSLCVRVRRKAPWWQRREGKRAECG